MVGKALPDCDHFTMRGRIAGGASDIVPAGENPAVPHNTAPNAYQAFR
jgi:hypothetical protein